MARRVCRRLEPGMEIRVGEAVLTFLGRKRRRERGERRAYFLCRQDDEVQWYTAAEFRALCGAGRDKVE